MRLLVRVLLLLSTTSFVSAPTIAHEGETLFIDQVKVRGRAYTHSCRYYSNTEADLQIEFSPDPLAEHARVFVDLGWEGYDAATKESFSWRDRTRLELKPSRFNRWIVSLNQIIANRSSSSSLNGMNFVFRVEVPGMPIQIFGGVEKGDEYFLRFPESENFPCTNSQEDLPEFEEWVVQINRT